ncbi:Membrane-anchored ribosome-binding protein, inhibits growth in stationary phase, ElaB/YqjD/DUF883 family [Rhizobium mongolense subsp. loessense]|uniref:Membrane-anchored ribosome-binding protein, inhibits growth in stationary phase, ElaB/YqjD/DUF883 family n=1 Tax=Rhizobium mongolense subsp. loessense TaxID=158890 RepID=A0A1G4TJ57_9HYPH|nr:hypothetical protein [Rhizobium mongolense]SCW81438.1 Membrane-anchored ribosome-binding protein, inhibits growth in stationary phase, ElaB/YqjD/DUF883 family [Rhizobium mongolense subsp. loessense]
MPNPDESPAVQSMKREQAQQRKRSRKGELEKGLEDTFPASDPVSITHTTAPSGRVDAEAAERVQRERQPETPDEKSPLVDEALSASRKRSGVSRGEIMALRSEVSHLSESATELASGTVRIAKVQARSLVYEIEAHVRARPLTAVGIVAAVAYLWGATR